MSPDLSKPPTRQAFAAALAVNAASKPLNIALLLGTMGGGLAVGAPLLVALTVALALYAVACARTFFDADEAQAVAAEARDTRRARLARGQTKVDPMTLAPDIRQHLLAARDTERRIRDAIERARLPYAEVSAEVDQLVGLMEQSAFRAQLLHDALEDTPIARVRGRLRDLEGSGKTELIDALELQLAVQQKMSAQLQKFSDEMERVVVELDTVRGNLLSVSASTDSGNQQRIAADVRSLRDEVGALSSGMDAAFG